MQKLKNKSSHANEIMQLVCLTQILILFFFLFSNTKTEQNFNYENHQGAAEKSLGDNRQEEKLTNFFSWWKKGNQQKSPQTFGFISTATGNEKIGYPKNRTGGIKMKKPLITQNSFKRNGVEQMGQYVLGAQRGKEKNWNGEREQKTRTRECNSFFIKPEREIDENRKREVNRSTERNGVIDLKYDDIANEMLQYEQLNPVSATVKARNPEEERVQFHGGLKDFSA